MYQPNKSVSNMNCRHTLSVTIRSNDDALIEYSKKFLIYDDGEAAHSLRGEYIDVSSPLGPLAAQVVECANYMHRKAELKGRTRNQVCLV